MAFQTDRIIEINGRRVGCEYPTYIVAEISAYHSNNLDKAISIIKAAKEAGADAIKLQTYTSDTMTIGCDTNIFRIKDILWEGKKLYELYRDASTPWEWHPKLKDIADELGLDFFSTAFDDSSVNFLQSLKVPVYKVASFEIVDLLLLRKMSSTGNPIILSAGMATSDEIEEVIQSIGEAGKSQVGILKCTSACPAYLEMINLRTIPHMIEKYSIPVGLSDHSLNEIIPATGVALNASIIEKYITLSRSDSGPGSAFSLEPGEFHSMVKAVRTVERAMGKVHYGPIEKEKPSLSFRRSLFVVLDIGAGERFTCESVRSIRPSNGIHPRFLEGVLGKGATRKIERGTPLTWDMVCDESKE